VTERGYDPSENPRWLGNEDQGPDLVPDQLIHSLAVEVQTLAEVLECFDSPGWAHVEATLRAHVQHVKDLLVSGSGSRTLEDLAFVRGEVRAVEFLLGLKDGWRTDFAAKREELNAAQRVSGDLPEDEEEGEDGA
jgi:hypothetical protein